MNRFWGCWNWDSAGMWASFLCMIHCLAFPFLLIALPLFSTSEVATGNEQSLAPKVAASSAGSNECHACAACESSAAHTSSAKEQHIAGCCTSPIDFWFHVGMLGVVIPIGLVALGVGFKQHFSFGPLMLGSTGMLLLIGALVWGIHLWAGRGEQIMTVSGSIAMVSAHFWNQWHCRCCQKTQGQPLVQLQGSSSEQLLPQTQ